MDPLSPWLIVIVYAADLVGLVSLGSRAHGWRIKALVLIPLGFVLLYSYLGIFDPPIEFARQALRYMLLFSGGIGGYVIYDYLWRIRKSFYRRRHDDR